MNKCLVLFASLALLASCAQNEVSENIAQENAIGFNSFSYSMTKAGALTDNIKLYAVNQDALNPNDAWFFEGQKLTYSTTTSGWGSYTYSPLKYWPINPTHGINFYAWAPESSTNVTVALSSPADSANKLTYTVPTDANEDFKIAKITGAKKGATAVRFTFEHLLSKVTIGAFECQNLLPGYTAAVTQVEMINLANTATRPFNSAPTNNWDLPTGNATYTLSSTNPTSVTGSLYIMPQTFSANAKLAFTITLTETASGATDTKTVTINLNNTAMTDWQIAERGKNYLLNLELDANKNFDIVQFEAEVTDWADANVSLVLVEPTTLKLNSMTNSQTLVIGGATSNVLKLSTDLSWDWSGAAYAFNGIPTTGNSFSMTFTNVKFDSKKITIKVPTGFRINIDADTNDQQTVDVTTPSEVVKITKR